MAVDTLPPEEGVAIARAEPASLPNIQSDTVDSADDPDDLTPWEQALAQYERCRVAHLDACHVVSEAESARSVDLPEAEKAQATACDAEWEAIHELIRTRAPDAPAIAKKIEVAIEATLSGNELLPLLADLRNLEDPNDAYRDGADRAQEQFALAWLKFYTERGGSVTVRDADPTKASISMPTFSFSPKAAEYEAYEAKLRETDWFKAYSETDKNWHLSRTRSMWADRYEGGMRELFDFIQEVPQGVETVAAIVALIPSLGYRSRCEDRNAGAPEREEAEAVLDPGKLVYSDTEEQNPEFDAEDFRRRWSSRLGSSHRHYLTRSLILHYPRNDLRGDERRQLQAELESHPGNVGSLLAHLDQVSEEQDRSVRDSSERAGAESDQREEAQ